MAEASERIEENKTQATSEPAGAIEKTANNKHDEKTEEEVGTPERPTPLQEFKKNNDVLLMLYPKDRDYNFLNSITEEDEITIYELVKDKKDCKASLLILLDTSGGSVYTAIKIMDTLRTKYQDISIAIPQEAKSSGTMMCCGANKLIMGPISELGPLDKPMSHPKNELTRISALDITRSIDETIDAAIERQKKLAKEINNDFSISMKDSLAIAAGSISKLISPMLCQEDIKIYNQAKRLLAIAETYGSELLEDFMLKDIKDKEMKKRIASYVIRRIVWLYPDHSFAIRRDQLRDLFFKVDSAENVLFWPELWDEFRKNVGSNNGKVIKFI